MIKKRLLAIAFSCILAVSAIPVMPVWRDAVSVKADEITVEKTEYEGPKKNAPERQTIYHTVDENDLLRGGSHLHDARVLGGLFLLLLFLHRRTPSLCCTRQ